jgi:hypothetical protein
MIPLAFLLCLGLREGFLSGELPAMAAACGLVLIFPVVPVPTGFAAAVLVAAIIGQRVAAGRGVRGIAGVTASRLRGA